MATTKVTLYKSNKKKNGSYPLAVRIIKDRKVSYVFLDIYLFEKDWDEKERRVKKSFPNSAALNLLISKKVNEIQGVILDATINNKVVSAINVKKRIKHGTGARTFFQVAEERYQSYKKIGKHSVAESDKSKLNNIKSFLHNGDISFSEITPSFLERLKVFLSSSKKTSPAKKERKNISPRYVMNHLLYIRTLYNIAIKEGIIGTENYPFGKGKTQIKLPESLKIGLDEKEVLSIESVELETGSAQFHARNKWLFSFYFAGMRISDVLQTRWRDFIDGRLHYRMGKNQKVVSVKVPEKLNEILDYYRQFKTKSDDFVFPDMKTANLKDKKDVYRKLNSAIKNTNKRLQSIAKKAGIEKKLTNHIARHSFGNIAGDKISPQMLQKLYRHSDIRTTMGYQANFIHKSADEALESVINF